MEIPVSTGYAYAQFFYDSKFSGPCIRIFKGIYPERPSDIMAIVTEDEQFITFLPVPSAVVNGFLTVVGHAPVPERLQHPPLFKSRTGPIWTGHQRPLGWEILNDETREKWDVGPDLPPEYHHLPTWCIECYTSLVDRIEMGWTNESDVFGPSYREILRQRFKEQESLKKKDGSAEPTASESPKTSETAFSGNNPLELSIRKLLTRLDVVSEKHEEVADTDVMEQMSDAVWNGFIQNNKDYVLPDALGMFTKTANKKIYSALSTFIKQANRLAEKAGLTSPSQRLNAFQDTDISSENGTCYDEYFGHREI